ncbi:MAG: hypothetical protein K0Q87_4359 [Neobacillus sp.]|jgi:hypothetical protein|nr:hypothetical protein [Neobacillus sp.]
MWLQLRIFTIKQLALIRHNKCGDLFLYCTRVALYDVNKYGNANVQEFKTTEFNDIFGALGAIVLMFCVFLLTNWINQLTRNYLCWNL